MGFEDRAYSRQPTPSPWGWLMWLFSGSVPLFTFAGIHVRAHATMLLFIGLTLLFGARGLNSMADQLIVPSLLFFIVLLHEFGHCFACRAVGGEANEIIMHPLGGLALVAPPRRPLPDFITTAGGPLVNVVLLVAAALAMYAMGGRPSWNPFSMTYATWPAENRAVFRWAFWMFVVNYSLLVFNLIPSFPLDGGRMLLAALWRPLGFYKASLAAATIGLVGGVGMLLAGLAGYGWMLSAVGIMCTFYCVQYRAALKAAGPWAFSDEDNDYAAASWSPPKPNLKADVRAERRREREALAERAEQERIDRILEKVHHHGMHSLSFLEKRALKNATERQRQRTLRRRR